MNINTGGVFYPGFHDPNEIDPSEIVLLCDPRRRFIAVQTSLCRDVLGLDFSEIIGQRCDDLFGGAICPMCPFTDTATQRVHARISGKDGYWCKVTHLVPLESHEGIPWMAIVMLEVTPGNAENRDGLGPLIGRHPQMQQVYSLIEKVARTDVSVLIGGETGTGKGLVAQTIHRLSPRAKGPLVKLNCAHLPQNLVEHELFGREKSAFTGASDSRPGRLEQASGGTLFLDEIGDLPLEMQVKLLQVIEDKQVERLGIGQARTIDVRFVCAANKDLPALVSQGAFREDLYYRLKGIACHLPPLRERLSDLPLLTTHFLLEMAHKTGYGKVYISPAAINVLRTYDWPGNIRELQHALEAAATLCDGQVIKPEHLPDEIIRNRNGPRSWRRLDGWTAGQRRHRRDVTGYGMESLGNRPAVGRGSQNVAAKNESLEYSGSNHSTRQNRKTCTFRRNELG